MIRHSVVISCLAIVLCTGAHAKTEKKKLLTFSYNVNYPPQTYDPHESSGGAESYIFHNTGEGLLVLDKSGNPVPGTAESLVVSKNRLTYTFKIREKARWSNGKSVTAHDFVNSYRRLMDPKNNFFYRNYFDVVAGAHEFISGKTSNFGKVGIKALDDQTLEIKLKRPYSYFLNMLTFWVTHPVYLPAIKKYGKNWTKPEHIVTNGPYKLAKVSKDLIIIRKNPYYYGPEAKIDEVFIHISDIKTARKLFVEGRLDLLRYFTTTDILKWKASDKLVTKPTYYNTYVAFNIKSPVFKDTRVRQALAMSIDRKKIVRTVRSGQIPQPDWIPKGMIGHNPAKKRTPNIIHAQRLLAQAGFNKKAKRKIRLIVPVDKKPHFKIIANELVQQWKSTLGITVTVVPLHHKVFYKMRNNSDFDIYLNRWTPDYPDPNSMMQLFLLDKFKKWTGWNNPRFEKFIELASFAPRRSERQKLYEVTKEILMDKDAIIVSLVSDKAVFLHGPRVIDFDLYCNYFYFKNIRLKN